MTALRALMIELGLADGVSNRLRGIDSQIDGIESGAIGLQGGFDDLGRATTEYGRVAGQEIAGVGKDVTELDKQVEGHADVTATATEDMAKSWGKVGAAIGAAALATEAYLRSQQDMYFAGDKIAYITGLERDEVIGLAVDLTNLSFSMEDAYGVMEVGARQGLRSRAELAAYGKVWDEIGTASGENAVALAEAAVSLRSVGIEATDLADTYDVLGFAMKKQMGVADLLQLTGYMAKDMDAYNMAISDVAVTLAALEEKGMGAANAKRALRSAMSSAKGDTTALYRELGITDDQLSRLNEEVAGGADYIAAMGDAYNESRTPLQWVQVEATKISHALGRDLNPLLETGSIAMTGLSSALLMGASGAYIYSVASTTSLIPSLAASTASAWAFTTALMANPLTWVVVGIVGLGAALYLLAANWDGISGWFMDTWDTVAGAVSGAIGWIGGVLSGIADLFWQYHPIGILIRQWDDITSYLQGIDLFETGRDILLGLVSGILDVRQRIFDTVLGIGEGIADAIIGFFGIRSPSKLMMELGGHIGSGFSQGVVAGMEPIGVLDMMEIQASGGDVAAVAAGGGSFPEYGITPERSVTYSSGGATVFAPSTTIQVTAGSGDAREIATAVDRRLRQTFDRHAEVYFGRQRRRIA